MLRLRSAQALANSLISKFKYMLRFFRRIRQKLITEGYLSKYLVYALGEIFLVMIGILLALQINNWNEDRKERILEKDYLISLKKEFENNLEEVDRVIRVNKSNSKNAKELAENTGPSAPAISEERFAKLLFGAINNEVVYRPGSGVINEIINSGKLNIFESKELKNKLATLDGLMLKIRNQENIKVAVSRYELIDQMQKGGPSSRKLAHLAFGDLFEVDGGKFKGDNLQLLNSKTFDNELYKFIGTSFFLDLRYAELKDEIQEVIEILDDKISK